ncbi:MAG: FAD-dependent oxidoreductase [Solirubrobacterales bacterium]|nr:FAD-dependent oxidoreductase [Solirubrobacterales bacterium]
MTSTLVIGGGLAAQRCIEALHREGAEGPITMVSDEPSLPYDRPPLSKEALSGDEFPDTSFRTAEWYVEHGVELVLGDPATDLETGSGTVWLASGAQHSADRILLATGSRAKMIPGFDAFLNSHVLRSAADARLLRDALVPGTKLTIIGAGFIGLEVASTARKLGVEVTIIEAEDIPLRGILGHELGTWLAAWHRREGVDLRCGTGVAAVKGERVAEAVVLSDGSEIPLDHLLVAVGAAPNSQWLESSGLNVENGIRCNAVGQTDAEGIWAAGDVACHWNDRLGRHHRTEHWEAAGAEARAVAKDMLGLPAGAEPMSSFWSDMYGVRLQHLGKASDTDRLEIDGETDSLDFEAIWYDGDTPTAALAVGRPRSLPALRKLFTVPTLKP